jgi:hypothetical protein
MLRFMDKPSLMCVMSGRRCVKRLVLATVRMDGRVAGHVVGVPEHHSSSLAG